jgi:hypothetical protein
MVAHGSFNTWPVPCPAQRAANRIYFFSIQEMRIQMDSHIIDFYEDDASYGDLLLCHIDPALRAGEACVVLATKPHRESLEAQLTARGLYANGVVASVPGAYIALDMKEVLAMFMVDGWPDEQRFVAMAGGLVEQAAKLGNGRARIFGEGVGMLFEDGKHEAAIRLEQLWNQLSATHSFTAICSYPARLLGVEQHRMSIHATCNEHSGICLP